MTYSTYEFTAFAEADIASDGNLSCGDKFTMPANATICFEVKDNDAFLSGDRRDNSTDKSYQTAEITDFASGEELGNGGQIYAESYFWVKDVNTGEWHVLIEIEQEGTGEDYFTFYTGHGYSAPDAGAELKVIDKCNVKGSWVDFKCLDAGVKFEPDPDGKIVIEAEDLELCGYQVEHQDAASGDELIKLKCGVGYAKLPDFQGESGCYDIEITVIDENDGKGFLDVFVDGEFVGCFRLDQNDNGNGVSNVSFTTLKLSNIEIPEGAEITFKGTGDAHEFIRIDKIAFCPIDKEPEFRVCDDPDAVLIDFEGFAAGTVIDDEYALDGVTITAQRDDNNDAANDAMVFDSSNPTGGDTDLATQNQGNLLIISEDNDSSDPDDAVGGTITFTFDNPSFVYDIKAVDTEEGGTITLTLEDGSTQSFDIPSIPDGAIQQVLLDVDNVVEMEIVLDGSGAVDDLCFVPGEPPLGEIGGRYFCDENRDDVDNSEPGVAGALVELLDAAGNVIDTTFTDSNGDYCFENVAEGTYSVRFQDPDAVAGGNEVGKTFVAPNAGTDDEVDSDVENNGTTAQFTLGAGEIKKNVDAGIEKLPAGLGDFVFNDANRNGVQDAGEVGIDGAEVKLLADLDNDGEIDDVVATTTTGDNPNEAGVQQGYYEFTGLEAGDYKVMFVQPDGFNGVSPVDAGGDDGLDSDGDPLNGLMTGVITLDPGEFDPTVDQGFFVDNAPEPEDDAAELCLGDMKSIDVLANDVNTENDGLTITEVNGVAIAEGGSVVLASGATVTLEGGQLKYDSTTLTDTSLTGLIINETGNDGFSYTVADDGGNTDTADVDVTIKGATDTVEKVAATLPSTINFTLSEPVSTPDFVVDVTLSGSNPTDTRLDGLVTNNVFCVNADIPTVIYDQPIPADVYVAEAGGLPAGLVLFEENLDLVNWILNQDFRSIDNGDGTGDTFTGQEIQEAIWFFTNDKAPEIPGDPDGDGISFFGTTENIQDIIEFALDDANRDGISDGGAEGFVAGEDNVFSENNDVIGLILDPNLTAIDIQPFIVGVELFEECIC